MEDVQPQSEVSATPTRRRFHIGAIYGLMTAISAALGLPALAYLLVPGKARKKQDWIEVGDITRLTLNVPVELAFRRNRVDGSKTQSYTRTARVAQPLNPPYTASALQAT